MQKYIIEVKEKPTENGVIIFKNGEWCFENKDILLNDLKRDIIKNTQELQQLNLTLKQFKDSVNEKLKDYHEVLQILTKEE